MAIKPNHICANVNCTNGENGTRAHYYACNYCSRTASWRRLCCSKACYAELLKSRAAAQEIRTDKSREEMETLMETPIEQVKQDTLKELEEYREIIETFGISEAIDRINEKLLGKDKN